MTLELRELAVAGAPPVSIDVPAGGWQAVRHRDPALLIDAIAGLQPAAGVVALDRQPMERAGPLLRARGGLATSTGRLPALPGLRVLDVLLLASGTPPGLAWRAALGLRSARGHLADAEALARALAGRLGVADWVDEPAVALPDAVVALVDVGRAVAARPRAMVWRAPEWLGDADAAAVEQALRAEQLHAGWAVLEVRTAAAPRRGGGLIIEVT